MKRLSSKVVASLLVVAVTASVAVASANTTPQCGDDKKDDKSGDTKPKG